MQDPPNSDVWVLGEELQINCNGNLIPEGERRVAAISESMENVELYEVSPKIVLPLTTAILERLV